MKPERPWTIFLIGVNTLAIKDIAIRDGALWTVRLSGCSDIIIHSIRVYNDMKLPNSDGIDLDCCQNVRISDCFLAGGDDTICVKATPGFIRYGTSENITVTGCTLVSTSSALVIGCEVRSTIRDLVFDSLRDSVKPSRIIAQPVPGGKHRERPFFQYQHGYSPVPR